MSNLVIVESPAKDVYKRQPYLAPAQAACGSEVRITRPVAEKLAASQHTQGVFALCRIPEPSLTAESLSPQGRYLVLSSLQDPGNIGAVLRSALAFGCDGLILSDDCPDLYSPKVCLLYTSQGGPGGLLSRQRPRLYPGY